jgi:endoglucanase
LAGAIGVVADAVVGAITNRAGNMIPGDAVGRAVANAVLGHALNYAVGALDAAGGEGAPAGALGKFVRTLAGAAALGAGNSQVAANMLAPLVGDVAELGSNAVGEADRERPPSGAGGSGSSPPSGSGGSGGTGSGGGTPSGGGSGSGGGGGSGGSGGSGGGSGSGGSGGGSGSGPN